MKRIIIIPGEMYGRLTVVGEATPRHNQWGKRRYILCLCSCGKEKEVGLGDVRSGKTTSCGCYLKERQIESKVGENNPQWKGDNVGYHALHGWINSNKKRPAMCEECNKKPPYDAANISGKYMRDKSDWRFLCRSCHAKSDNRFRNFPQHRHGKSKSLSKLR